MQQSQLKSAISESRGKTARTSFYTWLHIFYIFKPISELNQGEKEIIILEIAAW